jgi:uncharacterized protein with ATP-grasp and redox domains
MKEINPAAAREQAIKVVNLFQQMEQMFNADKNEERSKENMIMAISAGVFDAAIQGYENAYQRLTAITNDKP